MADHSRMKLGRKAIKTDSRTLKFRNYVTPALPPPPPSKDWTSGITGWGMMLNDQIGDCTIAGAGHAVQVWTACSGGIQTIPDSTLLTAYEQWGGYDPSNPTTDTGGVELDVLTDWQQQGLGGHKLVAFADPQFSNLVEIRQSIALYGGVYIGLALPLTARTQDLWDVVSNSGTNGNKGSWGGHCVYVPRYDETSFTCITWGQLKTMTLAFWNMYCDEAHTLLGQDWVAAKGSPLGFDQQQLLEDLKAIK